MQRMRLPEGLQKNIIYLSDECLLHENQKGQVIPSKMMMVNGQAVCPRCELDKDTARLEAEESRKYKEDQKNKEYRIFKSQSIVADETLLAARFANYLTDGHEEADNKLLMLNIMGDYLQEKTFNTFMQGTPGVGKSHLTYSLLHELNETRSCSCLFVSVDEMMRLIRGSINDKTSIYTENYFVNLLSSVDYLGLDDLGAESGASENIKGATDFVQRVLNAVTTARQSKSTITTTNLDSKQLKKMYDARIVSRLLKNPRFVVFKETKDKRISGIPF